MTVLLLGRFVRGPTESCEGEKEENKDNERAQRLKMTEMTEMIKLQKTLGVPGAATAEQPAPVEILSQDELRRESERQGVNFQAKPGVPSSEQGLCSSDVTPREMT